MSSPRGFAECSPLGPASRTRQNTHAANICGGHDSHLDLHQAKDRMQRFPSARASFDPNHEFVWEGFATRAPHNARDAQK